MQRRPGPARSGGAEHVDQGQWPSNIRDYLTDPDTAVTGYAADTWIQTSADVRTLVNAC